MLRFELVPIWSRFATDVLQDFELTAVDPMFVVSKPMPEASRFTNIVQAIIHQDAVDTGDLK